MAQTILIDPVTRIEGHAKISILLDDQDKVADARLHITQFRGFEKFVEGRPYLEMPALMARICGICPVSHLLTSAKACDELLAVAIPPTAVLLRRLMHLGQIIQSHALSFFHLASPDLLLGLDSDPARRNLFGVLQEHPQLARDGIRLRQFGQEVIALLGGKRVHPAWVVPGGVSAPLSAGHRELLLAQLPEILQLAQRTLDWYKGVMDNYREEIRTFGNFPSLYLGLVAPRGDLELYDGRLRFMNARGEIIADQVEAGRYAEYIEEAVEPDSYLKSPYYKPLGREQGMYRVGPLARLNLIDACGTPRADEEWAEFRDLERGPASSSFHYHYARLIEILYAAEATEKLLRDERILDPHVRAIARPNRREGIGVAEAPRGTLIHHYRIDDNGLMQWANLIIATGHNNLAMNRGILQVARHFVKNKSLSEGMLNRVEAVVRAYDPCLSCSTHAVGQMPLQVQLFGPGGELCAEARRD
jgi:NAD-reducing hydrogenase large subunit